MNYAFLTTADVLSRIRDEHRNSMTDRPESGDASLSDGIELTVESQAIAKIKSALNGRYNVAALFPAPPGEGLADTRHPLIVHHTLVLFVYLLYRRINPRKMPEEVKLEHDETLEWLRDVARGVESPDFPPLEDPEVSTQTPLFGGGQVRKGHYF